MASSRITPFQQYSGFHRIRFVAGVPRRRHQPVSVCEQHRYGLQTFPAIACSGPYSYLSPTPVVVDHNDVFNPSGPPYTGLCSAETGTNGNISADPLFTNSSSGDFHLLSGSPAISAGDTSVLADLSTHNINLTTDLDGNPRLQNATIDMGPYEYQPVPDFSITASPASLTVVPGQSGTSTILVNPQYGFNSS